VTALRRGLTEQIHGDQVHFCNEVSLRTCLIWHKWDVGESWKVCHILVQVCFCEGRKEREIPHPERRVRDDGILGGRGM